MRHGAADALAVEVGQQLGLGVADVAMQRVAGERLTNSSPTPAST